MQLNEFEDLQNLIKGTSPYLRSKEGFFRSSNKMKFDSKLESKHESRPISEEDQQITLDANPTIMEEDEYNFNNYKLLNTGDESPKILKQ